MSVSYDPDNSTALVSPWTTVQLSNRDLAGQIPINFVTLPSVSLAEACFGDNTYEVNAAVKCFSNLLAVHYGRFLIDLYWDVNVKDYLLCPVAIPVGASTGVPAPAPTSPLSTSPSAAALSTAMFGDATANSAPSSTPPPEVRRQETASAQGNGSSTLTPVASGNSSSSSTSTMSTSVPTSLTPSGETLYTLGPYKCTATLDLSTVMTVFLDFMTHTETTITANLIYIDINLHAAANASNPTEPAPTPSRAELPSGPDSVGSQISNSISQFIYTPGDLLAERADLNRTWYSVDASRAPIAEYFTTITSADGMQSTPDGWPCGDYVVIAKGSRTLLGWGTIDPQMQGYNFSADVNVIFPPNYLVSNRSTTATPDGNLTSGCFFNASDTSNASNGYIPTINSSFALSFPIQDFTFPATASSSLAPLSALASNLSTCGISPHLSTALLNATADVNPTPYQNLSYSTTWSWYAGEPRNTSRPGTDDDDGPKLYRCALLDVTDPYHGRWRVEDCAAHYPVACRAGNSPYNWTVTPFPVIFSGASSSCPEGQSFDAPRTGLENAYLHAAALALPRDSIDPSATSGSNSRTGVWLNFNSLDVQACWVLGGPNATCPYFVDPKNQRTREVLIPTIAAIIVLLLTALTLFVKCNVNRRMSRRRKRGEGGWDYEGVPS